VARRGGGDFPRHGKRQVGAGRRTEVQYPVVDGRVLRLASHAEVIRWSKRSVQRLSIRSLLRDSPAGTRERDGTEIYRDI